jgi:hypothetical protein
MNISGVTDATSVVPLLDPAQGAAKPTNAGPANDNDKDVSGSANIADKDPKIADKAALAPGTGKLLDKTV